MTMPGRVIGERFVLSELAATGGMGSVFRAFDRETGAQVAVKVVSGPLDAESRRRFAREARVLFRLRHPAIVEIVATGESPDGPFIAMEWLEGEDLGSRLGREGLGARASLRMALRIAEALGVAHAAGIVHRDIKPSNLFLPAGDPERVKILDFGVVRWHGATAVTRTGMLVGTAGYMAPEQVRGVPHIDARADVFSLGCVLFECLAGRPVWTGDHVIALLCKAAIEQAPRLRDVIADVPEEIDALVESLLSRDPEGRPEDGAAAARRIALALESAENIDRAPPRPSRPGITSLTPGEQRLVAVVLAGFGTAVVDAASATVAGPSGGELDDLRQRVLDRYDAVLEPLVDGSMVAVVESTGGATDLAERAASCALEMAKSTALSGTCIGVATGRAVLGARLPVGGVIDRVVMLTRLPPSPGAVRLDETTAGLLGPAFDVRGDDRGLLLGGRRELATAQRLLLGRPTPCVGRDRELRTIEAVYEQAADERAAAVVVLTGEPGIGKSRLRFEVCSWLAQHESEPEVWVARAEPTRAGSPYSTIASLVRGCAGLAEGEPLHVRRQKLRARIARNVAPGDVDRVTCFLAELVHAGFDDDADVQLRSARRDARLMGDRIRDAVERFVSAEVEAGPLVVVLDDLQWSDRPSVNVVDRLLRSLRDRAFVVIGLGRPEVRDAFPNLWHEHGATDIRLRPLSRGAVVRLARAGLGGSAPDTVVDRIAERADGNAFYAEELIRAASEGRIDEAPETVLAMVQARIEALEPELRRLLRAASILGGAFWDGALGALSGDGAGVARSLEEVVARELVAAREPSRFSGQRELVFRHALVRDAAYAMLTPEDRVLGHRLAARWLEERGEREALVLAQHYLAGEDPGKAAEWFERSAHQALEGDDFEGAIARADRGVEAFEGARSSDRELLGRFRLLQAEAHNWRAEYAAAIARATDAVSLLPHASAEWCRAWFEISNGAVSLDDAAPVEEAARTLWPARDIAPSRDLVLALAHVTAHLILLARHDRGDELCAWLEGLLPSFRASAPEVAARIHVALELRAYARGDIVARFRHATAAIDYLAEAGDRRQACARLGSAGAAKLDLGLLEGAERDLRRAAEDADRLGLSWVGTHARCVLALVVARLGRLDEAERLERETVAVLRAQNERRLEAGARIYLAEILLMRGDAAAAEREASEIVASLDEGAFMLPYALSIHARALLVLGRVREALDTTERAVRVLPPIESPDAVVHTVRAEALLAGGAPEAARALVERLMRCVEESAAALGDPAVRASFATRVPENVRIAALARALGLALRA